VLQPRLWHHHPRIIQVARATCIQFIC
jgi:hypothetical protein